mmetsp:Transcript_37771/g.66499  ORF Transcript_37771/g.66499 Transcript_37771/m.66499 type:complete len:976 (-) Transcript_37771:18-2945(-)
MSDHHLHISPPDGNLWSKVPGYDGSYDSEESDSEEEEFVAAAEERLQAVRRSLGQRWTEQPVIDFAAVSIHNKGPPPQLKVTPAQPSDKMAQREPAAFRIQGVYAPIVSRTFIGNGLCPTSSKDFLVQWSGPGMREFAYQGLHEFQRVNHFPGSTELTRKDRLWAHFKEMKQAFGSEAFDFVPESYVLPDQVEEFLNCYERTKHIWIVKPNASSQGKGIFLLRDLEDLPLSECSVVSRYVDNPLLIQGLKFDLRIYVLVTSYSPLRAYVYREGLTRFASSPYSTEEEHLRDAYRHLTNYSVNKFAHNFMENQELDADNYGHKWSLSALNKHLQCVGIDSDLMWCRIMDLIVKTLLSVEPCIASKTRETTVHPSNCFEVYGFDVLVDDRLKPWLLEVNLSPSMKADSPLDWKVKSSLLSDAFNLVGIPNPDRQSVASSRLRSRVLQSRRSLPERQSPYHRSSLVSREAPGVGPPPKGAFSDRPLALDKIGEEQLKMLAGSLAEIGRCSNFIRLHPTRNTVERYYPIIDPRGPRGSEFSEGFRGRQHAVARLLASILFGPPPQLYGVAVAKLRLTQRLSVSGTREGSSPRKSTDSTQSGGEGESDTTSEGEESDVDTVSEKGKLDRTEEFERVAPVYNPSIPISALQVLLQLGNRPCFRLVLMEYLIRISNTCNKLGVEERARLAQSAAFSRLSHFREQLLETTGRLYRKPAHVVQNLIELGDGAGLVESLATACHASLGCLARDAWDGDGALEVPPPLSSPRLGIGSLTLASHLLPTFVQGALGQQALSTFPSLGAADLEWILLDAQCPAEFRQLLQPFAPDVNQHRRHHKTGQTPVFERRHLQPFGVLTELLCSASARPPSAPRPISAQQDNSPPQQTVVVRDRQYIFPRMEPPPRPAPPRSRSTPVLPRLVPEPFSPGVLTRRHANATVWSQTPSRSSSRLHSAKLQMPGAILKARPASVMEAFSSSWNIDIEL